MFRHTLGKGFACGTTTLIQGMVRNLYMNVSLKTENTNIKILYEQFFLQLYKF